jgi:hypothetical protein
MKVPRALFVALAAWLLVGFSSAAMAANPAPDRLTVSGNSVVLGWEPQALSPATSVELEWILQRADFKVLTWSLEAGGFVDDSYGTGAHVTTAVARHWHTWRGAYAGLRGGLGLQVLAPGVMLDEVPSDDPATWGLVARIPVGIEVGWQHPARGWRLGLRLEQVIWAPYAWKLDYRVGVQSSLGAVVSVPLFWKRGVAPDQQTAAGESWADPYVI